MQYLTSRHAFHAALFISALLLLAGCGTPATPAAQPTSAGATVSAATAASTVASTAASTVAATVAATAAPTLAATPAATTPATPVPTLAPTAASTVASTTAATGSASGNRTTIVLTDVNDTPAKTISAFQPLADYLGSRLGKYGITSGEVKVAPNNDTLVKWLKAGEIDLVFNTPYPVMLLMDSAGAQPIMRQWKGGDAEYYTVVFARADTGMKSLPDLKGKMLAVQDAFSTSGYFLPLAYMAKAGIKTTSKDSADAPVAPDEVGYTASKDDNNTLQWVISGKVAAGATDIRHYQSIPEETRKQLVILLQTDKVPRSIVLARPGMDPALVEGIKAALMDLDKTDDGKKILKTFQTTAKFDELPGGPDAALADVRNLLKIFQQR